MACECRTAFFAHITLTSEHSECEHALMQELTHARQNDFHVALQAAVAFSSGREIPVGQLLEVAEQFRAWLTMANPRSSPHSQGEATTTDAHEREATPDAARSQDWQQRVTANDIRAY